MFIQLGSQDMHFPEREYPMNRLSIAAGTLVLLSTLLVAGCSPAATEEPTSLAEATRAPTIAPQESASAVPTEEVKEPVVLRVGGLMDADCWNPYTCTAPYIWGQLLFEGFTAYGPTSEGCPGEPRLADSWEVSPDGRTWTIHLHEGIAFSDGVPLTAGTVKEFLEWAISYPDTASWFNETKYLESVEVVDELTLRYTTSRPIIHSPDSAWQVMFILPPHIWGELDESEIFTFESYPPFGTGPYVLTEQVPGSYMIFDVREDYYRGKPPIDRVVYQIYANADALINALLAGEIDLTTPVLPPEAYDVFAADARITVEEQYPRDLYDLTFNMYEYGTGHPALRDPAVRLAIDYAIDKQHIIDIALLGHGIVCPTNWACGPNFEGELNPDLEITPFDLEEARRILDDAGYVDTDGDGIRESPEGLALVFTLYFATDFPPELTISQLIADWLTEIGIEVDVEALDWGTWFFYVSNQHDFDMAIDLRTPEVDPAAIDFWFSCWAAEPGPFTFNASGYCNEEMDELVAQYIFSDDPQARWGPIYAAQEIINQDRPIIVLAGPTQMQAYRNDRFEFQLDTCYADFLGMYGPQGLLGATVK
jgi:peptide/nickel transport system substrate-binding protein